MLEVAKRGLALFEGTGVGKSAQEYKMLEYCVDILELDKVHIKELMQKWCM